MITLNEYREQLDALFQFSEKDLKTQLNKLREQLKENQQKRDNLVLKEKKIVPLLQSINLKLKRDESKILEIKKSIENHKSDIQRLIIERNEQKNNLEGIDLPLDKKDILKENEDLKRKDTELSKIIIENSEKVASLKAKRKLLKTKSDKLKENFDGRNPDIFIPQFKSEIKEAKIRALKLKEELDSLN